MWDAETGEYRRESTLAGGTEGGMTTGELLVVRAAMKPLATLNRPTLKTVDVVTKESTVSFKERTDVTAVPAMGVVAETMVALVLAAEAQRKFGGDSVAEFVRNAECVPQLARMIAGRCTDQHLVLVGMMGSGKTTVGRIARRAARPAVARQRPGHRGPRPAAPCARSSPTDGEAAFRAFESEALLDALADRRAGGDRRRRRRGAPRGEPRRR